MGLVLSFKSDLTQVCSWKKGRILKDNFQDTASFPGILPDDFFFCILALNFNHLLIYIGFKSRASHMLGKCPTTETQSPALFFVCLCHFDRKSHTGWSWICDWSKPHFVILAWPPKWLKSCASRPAVLSFEFFSPCIIVKQLTLVMCK